MTTPASWSISVKTVGGSESVKAAKAKSNAKRSSTSSESNNGKSAPHHEDEAIFDSHVEEMEVPSNFTVSVQSSDKLSILHDKIEEVTGLQACQQRLIYRGRLIAQQGPQSAKNQEQEQPPPSQSGTREENTNSGMTSTPNPSSDSNTSSESSSKPTPESNSNLKKDDLIGDIEGLCDGQTIHLVPRPLPTTQNQQQQNSDDSINNPSSASSVNISNTSASASATSLLATLLGLTVPGGITATPTSTTTTPISTNTSTTTNTSNNGNIVLSDEEDFDTRTRQRRQERRRQQFRSLSNVAASRTLGLMSSSRRSNPDGRAAGNDDIRHFQDGVWDRNPLEPVRQGLMTLHTLLESHPSQNYYYEDENEREKLITHLETNEENDLKPPHNPQKVDTVDEKDSKEPVPSSLSKSKALAPLPLKWYRGQWLDVKDTVEQWLEATIVQVFYYQDIFTPEQIREYKSNAAAFTSIPCADPSSDLSQNQTKENEEQSESEKKQKRKEQSPQFSKMDPIVGASDVEGRKALFLEEIPNRTDEMGHPVMKFRDNVEQTQLILVHYNGWPHRWDEWIRGDSNRIRIFRTKTRHSPLTPFASPTPNSIFHAAPTTYIYEEGENDRAALLPEIQRALEHVQHLLSEVTSTGPTLHTNANEHLHDAPPPYSEFERENLNSAANEDSILTSTSPSYATSDGANVQFVDDCDKDLPWLDLPHIINPIQTNPHTNSNDDGIQDVKEDLDSEEEITKPSSVSSNPPSLNTPCSDWMNGLSRQDLGTLAPLLDRLGRTLMDAAPHVAALASTLPLREDVEEPRLPRPRMHLRHPPSLQVASLPNRPHSSSHFTSFSTDSHGKQSPSAKIENDPDTSTNNDSSERTNLNLLNNEPIPVVRSHSSATPAISSTTMNQQLQQDQNKHPHANRNNQRSAQGSALFDESSSEVLDYSQWLVNTNRDDQQGGGVASASTTRRPRNSASSVTSSNSTSTAWTSVDVDRSNTNAASFLGNLLAARNEDGGDGGEGGSTVPLARFLRVSGIGGGGRGGSTSGTTGDRERAANNSGGGSGGIDIHIHAIVGMDVGMGLADAAGAFPFVGLQPITTDDGSGVDTTTGMTATTTNGGGNGSTTVEEEDEGSPPIWTSSIGEEDEDLFSDLYTASPPPFQFVQENVGMNDFQGDQRNENRIGDYENDAVINREQNESLANEEETAPLVAYSMVVGDIPTSIPVDQNLETSNSEARKVSVDVKEENESLTLLRNSPDHTTPIASFENISRDQISQSQHSSSNDSNYQTIIPNDPRNNTRRRNSSDSSTTSNGRRRSNASSTFKRFKRVFGRRSNSRS